jgi:hypothetical protein
MEGGRNITAILTGGIVKGFADCSDGLGTWRVSEMLVILTGGIVKVFGETVEMGWVHRRWQKYYSYTNRGDFEEV